DTEYRLSAIPIGGYVKMAGENIGDPRTGAPDELTSKSAWSRLQIFAAGALMNLVIAFPIAILAFLAGKVEWSPVVGQPSGPDLFAGIRTGDRIVKVNGHPVASMDDYRKQLVRQRSGTQVPVVVIRGDEELQKTVIVGPSYTHGTRPPATILGKIRPGSPADKAGLRSHDRIVKINLEPPPLNGDDLVRLLTVLEPGQVIELAVVNSRDDPPGERGVTLKDMPLKTEEWIEADLHLFEPVITEPAPESPAARAGFRAGDRIRKIADIEVKSWHDLREALSKFIGQTIEVQVERPGEAGLVTLKAPITLGETGKGILGVGLARSSKIAEVAEGSFFYQAGLRSGDEVLTIDAIKNAAVKDFAEGRAGPVDLQIRRGDKTIPITIKGVPRHTLDLEKAGFETSKGKMVLEFDKVQRHWSFGEAVSAGLWEPVDITGMTFQVLGKLFVREESAKGLAGPVQIFQASFIHAKMSLGNLLWLLVLITVNLGIFNLLPIPVLDGGHILLLAIEKVRGAPPSLRFVERFQLIGILMLLSLLIFVTVNDIHNVL
ncbi:MAG TPA: site-2 protease family protein, partial [Planctomycetota bacterium]|nr:site-2 protease family protein [Planctomycetota bacterium]